MTGNVFGKVRFGTQGYLLTARGPDTLGVYLEGVMHFRKVHMLQRVSEPMYAGQARQKVPS